MKNKVLKLLVLVMCVGVLAGCGKNNESNNPTDDTMTTSAVEGELVNIADYIMFEVDDSSYTWSYEGNDDGIVAVTYDLINGADGSKAYDEFSITGAKAGQVTLKFLLKDSAGNQMDEATVDFVVDDNLIVSESGRNGSYFDKITEKYINESE